MTFSTPEDDRITIPEYFSGKTIFVTGGSGFMGKVLLEKLLRSCPDLSKIYVLLRPKRGKSIEERVKAITDLELFDILKKENPTVLKKIVPLSGDVRELQLGLSQEDQTRLIDEVNIVYHAAASVRFDDPLTDAIIMNTRGTREVVTLAKQMKHLEVLLHISTTYCHTDRKVIGEQIYPPLADWRDSIRLAETVDKHVMDIMTPKYMEPLPNSYTFTKGLAEHVVNDLCDGQIPSIIIRPSIVISSQDEPVPGWVDNFNGPFGILIASGKGILRSIYTDPNIMADYVPVDFIIKGMLIATWLKGIEKNEEEKLKISVYNASNNRINNITMGQLVDMGKRLCWDYPLNNVMWYPNGSITRCYFMHFVRLILFHLIPAVIIDGILKLAGKKPILVKVQRKIYIANMALQYFITQEWQFVNDKASNLEYTVLPSDAAAFTFNRGADPYDFFTKGLKGARQYLLREDISTFPQAKVHSRRMYVLFQLTNILWYIAVFYYLFFKWQIQNRIGDFVVGMFDV